MSFFTDYREVRAWQPDRFTKSTLFQTERILLGLNCFEPGQAQAIHSHADQDKFYLVLEGAGRFTVGDETRTAGAGVVVRAPAGVPHGVANDGSERLVVLVGIAPA